MGKYLLAWFPMVAIAILNGMARQYVYGGRLCELRVGDVVTFSLNYSARLAAMISECVRKQPLGRPGADSVLRASTPSIPPGA